VTATLPEDVTATLIPGAAPLVRVRTKGYYKDTGTGEKYTSVTTILDRNVAKHLEHWAGNTVARCAMDNLPYLVKSSRDVDERIDAYEWLKRAHERKKNERGAIGTAIHSLIEAQILGTPLAPEVAENPEFVPYQRRFEDFVREWRVEFTASEMIVANTTYGYGGTLDTLLRSALIAEVLGVNPALDIAEDTKGLALDTLLPTPTGWTTMAAVQVGDVLLSSLGAPCVVTEVSDVHQRDCYRVTFDDGSSVVCDDEHLWLTDSGAGKVRRQVATTVQLRSSLWLHGQRQHRVPVVRALDLPARSLPIDSYVLGVWLGDGKHTSGEITNPDSEIFDHITAAGYLVGPPQKVQEGKCQVRTVRGLVSDLRATGVLGNRHVPDSYLRGSFDQRLSLLQGLMDTDGTWNRVRNSAQFVSVSKAFANSVRELLLSLGQRAVMFEGKHTGFKAGVHYSVVFTPVGINPFRLQRKADLVSVPSTVRSSRRVIKSIEPTITVPTKCIAVDSPDRTYLCTEAMIPTHNTGGELDVKGVYPEAALQMSAYAHAEFAQTRAGRRVKMPPVADRGVVLHLRPEGYRLIPMEIGTPTFEQFLALTRLDRGWTRGLSKQVVGPALNLPVRGE